MRNVLAAWRWALGIVLIGSAAGGGAPASALAAGPTFSVSFDKSVRDTPATGRLVVYLLREGAQVGHESEPADGPFFEDPQPLYGIDVKDLAPGAPAVVDDAATSFPVKLSELPPGTYRAQAVLDLSRLDSSWRREPGNLFSAAAAFTIVKGQDAKVDLPLTQVVQPKTPPATPGVEAFQVRSELLSRFRGRDVMLHATVLLPQGYDKSRQYAAIYEIPGFGGDGTEVHGGFHPYRARLPDGSPWIELRKSAFWINLNPEGPNGHHLFANSANNGPVGDALVKELIPALEAKYSLRPDAAARLLRGHSSGGWSTLWLATQYPETFGATWSSSPDPVDFRRFQKGDIYGAPSMYLEGKDQTPSYRENGQPKMTVRQENLMEEVVGPQNTSGQQWDSWMAVFGPRDDKGNPAALYDPITGKIDHAVAEQYRAYDIADLLRRHPEKYGPLFKQRIHIVVGDQDSYYLNEAVALLKQYLDNLSFLTLPEGSDGYIKIVPGLDHGSIFRSDEIQMIPVEMVNYLKAHGLVKASEK
jgi:pimeloyl-ACP methyl ester carboxylesterase